MPGIVITAYVSGLDLGDRKSAMLTYLMNHQQVGDYACTHIRL